MKKQARGITVYILLVLAIIAIWYFFDNQVARDAAYSRQQFITDMKDGKVVSVDVVQSRDVPTGTLKVVLTSDDEDEEDSTQVKLLEVTNVNEAEDLMEEHGFTSYTVSAVPAESFLKDLLPLLLVFGAMFILFVIMMNRQSAAASGGNRMADFGKSRAKVQNEDVSKINFNNVAGLKEEKEDLEEIVDFLKQPQKYTDLGARIPKGVILVGPPGTGKTLLAKAIAGEAHVPFFSISGSDFVEMFVGVGASRVRDLFEEAKKNAPCIVFIDEIDAVARRRGTGMGGGHDEREQTLNQLLVEMDGFGVNEGIIVMAATNRVDILDPAIMRPGRFDRKS